MTDYLRGNAGTWLFAAPGSRGGAPGVTLKCFKSGDCVDARNGFVRDELSGHNLAQHRAAMGEPQRPQRISTNRVN
jgi:hypothetical protein